MFQCQLFNPFCRVLQDALLQDKLENARSTPLLQPLMSP